MKFSGSLVGSLGGVMLALVASGCSGASETLGAGTQEVGSPEQESGESATDDTDRGTQNPRGRGSPSSDSNADDSARSDAAASTHDSDDSETSADSEEANEAVAIENPLTDPAQGPPAGNPDGDCAVPSEALPVDTSAADNIVGDGTPQSCTGDAVIAAVERGGLIRFDCGPEPIVITLD